MWRTLRERVEARSKRRRALKDLARRIVRNEAFASLQLRDVSMLPQVFLPVGMADREQIKRWLAAGVVAFYADMKDALPRSINGLPMFMRCGTLTARDCKLLRREVRRLNARLNGSRR